MRGGSVFKHRQNRTGFGVKSVLRCATAKGDRVPQVLLTLVVLLGLAGAAQAERDPTRPPSSHVVLPSLGDPAAPEAVTTFRLTSVVVGKQRRLATINGKTVSVGQWVDGARVHSIDTRQVLLHWQGQQKTLTLSRRAVTKINREAK